MTIERLTFKEDIHEYFLDGKKIPSVTQVIQSAGLIDDTWFTEESRDRGKYVHSATHYLDEGDLDYNSVDESYLPYIKAYEKFRNECKPNWRHVEHKLFDEELWYAGTCDRIGFMCGKQTICDIKTGVYSQWHGMQTAAYRRAYKEISYKRYGLYLKKDETYKLVEYDDKNDIKIFKAALAIYNWSKK